MPTATRPTVGATMAGAKTATRTGAMRMATAFRRRPSAARFQGGGVTGTMQMDRSSAGGGAVARRGTRRKPCRRRPAGRVMTLRKGCRRRPAGEMRIMTRTAGTSAGVGMRGPVVARTHGSGAGRDARKRTGAAGRSQRGAGGVRTTARARGPAAGDETDTVRGDWVLSPIAGCVQTRICHRTSCSSLHGRLGEHVHGCHDKACCVCDICCHSIRLYDV